PATAGAPPGTAPSRYHQALALGAGVGQRCLVHRELALGVAVTRVERAELAAALDQLALLALRARHAGSLGLLLLDVLALGIAGAPDERAEPAAPPLQRPPALRALLVQQLGLGAASRPLTEIPGVGTHRVVRTADEPPVPAQLDLQL